MAKEAVVKIRIDEGKKKLWQEYAKACGRLSLTELVEFSVDEHITKKDKGASKIGDGLYWITGIGTKEARAGYDAMVNPLIEAEISRKRERLANLQNGIYE